MKDRRRSKRSGLLDLTNHGDRRRRVPADWPRLAQKGVM